jgi:general secretion pathway protein B
MSYILEALKKSERKRPPGPVPDLFTVRGPQPAVRSRLPLLVIAGVTAVAALAVIGGLVWFGGRSREPAAPPATPSAKQQPPLPASVPVAELVPTGPIDASSPAASAPAPARPAVGPASAKRLSTEVRRPQPAAKPAAPAISGTAVPVAAQPPSGGPAAAPAVPEPLQSVPPVVTAPPAVALPQPPVGVTSPLGAPGGAQLPGTTVPAAQATVTGGTPAMPPPPSTTIPAPAAAGATVPVPAPQEGAATDLPPADGRAVDIEELPQSLRSSLGKFSVSGHVWSEEPGLRLLTVENRIVRQGQEAAPGVRLEEITQDGAVFSARGWRFRVRGF